jgi:Kef-type K+ transport system membrane component KefB
MSADDVLLYLLIDLAIIIVVARSLGWLVTKAGQPRVIGEVLAGILLGPSILGRFTTSSSVFAPAHLFPSAIPLTSIANLGLVFFMFLVGLELDARLIKKEGHRAIYISHTGIVIPLVIGVVIGVLMVNVNNSGAFLAGTQHPPRTLVFALFLGAAMCITAFPVLARMLADTGLYKTAVGTATLCAAAVDDATAWVILAAVVGIARTGSPLQAVQTFVLALLFIAALFYLVRPLLGLLARRYDAMGRLTVDQVAIIVTGVLLCSFVTQRIGIHAIFGPFAFGVIMPRRSAMTRELTDKIEDFVVIALLPVFFAVTGLRTNLFAINSLSLVGWLLVIIAGATFGKFVGCGVAARVSGSNTRDSVTIGALMNTRGLTELVILSVGLSLGVLSDRTFAMMVVMAIVTTVMAAPVINRLMPRERILREIAELESPSAPEAPAAARILVGLGNPLNAATLVDAAIRMTGTNRPAELLLVRLIPTSRAPEFRSGLQDEESQIDSSIESMDRLVNQAAAVGITSRPLSFLSDDVAADLARVASNEGCTGMLLGWHRPSLPADVIRALVHRTFALAPCPVAVFIDRDGRGIMPESDRPVLVALHSAEGDAEVTDLGTRLATNLATSVRVAGYIGNRERRSVSAESESLALLADGLRGIAGVKAVPRYLNNDGTSELIAETQAAAVAVIATEPAWTTEYPFGPVTSELAEATECPLFVVHPLSKANHEVPKPWWRMRRSGERAASGV